MTTAADANITTIADRVAKLQEAMAGKVPDEIVGVFSAEQTELGERGIPAGIAEPGDLLGDFTLLDVHGASTTLSTARAGRVAVVVLYRGAWCPYCNLALHAYQEDLVPALADRGVELVAISPQKPDGSLSMKEKNELTFTVLSDPGNTIAKRLGVLTAPTDKARAAQRHRHLVDRRKCRWQPRRAHADCRHRGRRGVIRWIDVHPNYTTRTEVGDILAALNALH